MSSHYYRKDVVWKPAIQVRVGDILYGVCKDTTHQFVVTGVVPKMPTFQVQLHLQSCTSENKHIAVVYYSAAVAYPRAEESE